MPDPAKPLRLGYTSAVPLGMTAAFLLASPPSASRAMASVRICSMSGVFE
jgi:hypothetical protein